MCSRIRSTSIQYGFVILHRCSFLRSVLPHKLNTRRISCILKPLQQKECNVNERRFVYILQKYGTLFYNSLESVVVPESVKDLLENTPSEISAVSEYVKSKISKDLQKSIIGDDTKCKLNEDNYFELMKLIIHIEDEANRLEIEKCNVDNAQLSLQDSKTYSIQFNNHETQDKVMDAICDNSCRAWCVPILFKDNPNKREYGEVSYHDGKLLIKTKNYLRYANRSLYYIHFIHNRMRIQMQHQALNFFKNQSIEHFFFPHMTACIENIPKNNDDNMKLNWMSNELNQEQKKAVRSIIEHSTNSIPYILIGPPGTGKTKTIVEAICQIITHRPLTHVLVCATSNSSCNEICSRLLKFISRNDIFRMYTTSANVENIEDEIVEISNLSKAYTAKYKSNEFPCLNDLYQFKIVVSTLTIAGRLTQAKINPFHFEYVFIDECGSATEADAIIPIAGICTSPGKVNGRVIIAGDPKQLGPIVKSGIASSLGHEISLLERLLCRQVYRLNSQNNNFITHLVQNYRSHPAILKISSDLFYHSSLEAKGSKDKIDRYIGSKILPTPHFPIIFVSTQGDCESEERGTSLFNLLEIETVLSYVSRLLKASSDLPKITQNDIGIVSPYKKQCQILTDICKDKGWRHIRIGSVEVFQGKEKPIIIASTVRSNMDSIGFLDSPKRLNVLMSRAMCLLIIIGDPFTLASNSLHWRHVINYCFGNKAILPENQLSYIQKFLSSFDNKNAGDSSK